MGPHLENAGERFRLLAARSCRTRAAACGQVNIHPASDRARCAQVAIPSKTQRQVLPDSPARKRTSDRIHRVGEDGFLTRNRKGTELCNGYRNSRGFCKKNAKRRHQCAKRLSEFHGAKDCPCKLPSNPDPITEKERGSGGERTVNRLRGYARIRLERLFSK